MLTIEQFLHSCAHETKIIKNLANHVPESALDYRPSEGQRSMLEFMQYLTVTALVPMAWIEDGNWDRAPEISKDIGSVNLDNFGAAMDRQLEQIRAMAAKLEGRDLTSEMTQMPWQEPCTVGQFLVDAVIKSYSCYRMQFFLYAKGAGASHLNSMQCWLGVDPPAEA